MQAHGNSVFHLDLKSGNVKSGRVREQVLRGRGGTAAGAGGGGAAARCESEVQVPQGGG